MALYQDQIQPLIIKVKQRRITNFIYYFQVVFLIQEQEVWKNFFITEIMDFKKNRIEKGNLKLKTSKKNLQYITVKTKKVDWQIQGLKIEFY